MLVVVLVGTANVTRLFPLKTEKSPPSQSMFLPASHTLHLLVDDIVAE